MKLLDLFLVKKRFYTCNIPFIVVENQHIETHLHAIYNAYYLLNEVKNYCWITIASELDVSTWRSTHVCSFQSTCATLVHLVDLLHPL